MIAQRIVPLAFALAASVTIVACSQETASNETATPTVQAAEAPAPLPTVENFTLANYDGDTVELYAMKDAPAIVIVMEGVGCPINQKMMPTVKDTAAAFGEKGVPFFFLNANIQDTPEKIAGEAEKFDIKIPILKDTDQSVSKGLGVVRTAETFIIQPGTWKVVYHGPFDDRLTYGREKPAADNEFVKEVLSAMVAGEPVPQYEKQPADGCLINFS